MIAAAVIFWLSFAAIAYSYAIYAALISVAARVFGKRNAPVVSDALPTVSLLIAAHNEQACIESRIRNALASDYPKDKLEIVIASDGSTDATNDITRSFADRGVRLVEIARNAGKAAALNEAMKLVTGDIVVLSDANTFFQPDAIANLSRWFSDPSIGSVCGKLIVQDPRTGKNIDGVYWKYETFLKRCESRLGALLGSNGAIYAIRRDGYIPLPLGTIVDDFVEPLLIRLRGGGAIVFDESAIAREDAPERIGDEFKRRCRIGAGGFQSLAMLWPLLMPWKGWISFAFFSHKLLRWLCPFFMIGLIVCNAMLFTSGATVYRMAAVAQILFYAGALLAHWAPARWRAARLLRLSTMFVSMNLALLIGFWRWISGQQRGVWKRTARTPSESALAGSARVPAIARPPMERLEHRALPSVFFVSPSGSDMADGSADGPWATLQYAVDHVAPGDIVTVLQGTYAGFDMTASGNPKQEIVVTAQAGVVINRPNGTTKDGINLESASYVTIQGFNVFGMPRAGIRSVTNTNVRLLNNTVSHNQVWGILTGFSQNITIQGNTADDSAEQHGIYVGNSAKNPHIIGNTVFGNAMCGIHINADASQGGDGIITGALVEGNIIYGNGARGGAAINCDGVEKSVIENNLLYDNHASGVTLFRQDGADAAMKNLVVNNTIVMADDSRWAILVRDGAIGNTIENNIILTNHPFRGGLCVADDSLSGLISDYNCGTDRYSNNTGDSVLSLSQWQKATGQDAHSFVAKFDGMFVDPAHGDYRLAIDSPAIGGGTAAHAPKIDLRGQTRSPGRIDMGAFTSDHAITPAGLKNRLPSAARGSLPLTATGLAMIAAAGIWLAAQARRHQAHRWLRGYALSSRKRSKIARGTPVHALLCIADHYEPQNGDVSHAQAMERVRAWQTQYPLQFGDFRDSDGRPPRHSFFYPLEQYDREEMEGIVALCRQGFGEVEVHLHHDHDTSDNLRRTLSNYVQMLASRHGMLARSKSDGALRYGFIHGNWALDNSRPDGRWCGVNNELDILRETGCYADFTLPSAPSATQTAKINSIYYAVDDPEAPKSHDTGFDVGAGPQPDRSLMLIQGPLALNWDRRKWGVLPRIENACIQGNQAPNMARLERWMSARISVPTRPDWIFVKLHTHGAPEANQAVLLGESMKSFHRGVAQRAADDSAFHYHYVTAREMYNLAKAAEAGYSGSVAGALDFELEWNGAAAKVRPREVVSIR